MLKKSEKSKKKLGHHDHHHKVHINHEQHAGNHEHSLITHHTNPAVHHKVSLAKKRHRNKKNRIKRMRSLPKKRKSKKGFIHIDNRPIHQVVTHIPKGYEIETPKHTHGVIDSQLIQQNIYESMVMLERTHTNLAEKFNNLAAQISALLGLFEIAAKSFISNSVNRGGEEDKEFLEKIDHVLEQNKLLAKGLTMVEERMRERLNDHHGHLQSMADVSGNGPITLGSGSISPPQFGGQQEIHSGIYVDDETYHGPGFRPRVREINPVTETDERLRPPIVGNKEGEEPGDSEFQPSINQPLPKF